MKKKSPVSDRGSKIKHRSTFIPRLLFTSSLTAALLLPCASQATVQLDRQFGLETIGYLREVDNVDGLFVDYVSNAYRDYFSHQSRFVVQDLSKADTLLSKSKLPYYKLIQDNKVLAEVARVTHSQSIIRTKVLKEGGQYRFQLEWLQAPKMTPLAAESMVLREPRDGLTLGVAEVQGQISEALQKMIRKLPWIAHITGRDQKQVTVNIGSNAQIHKGDTLVISTLDSVKFHPILNLVVDWKLTRTGSLELDTVEDSLAFGHIVEEEPDQQIQRFQKITQLIPGSPESQFKLRQEPSERLRALEENPRLGFIRASLWPGGYSRQYNAAANSNSREGGGPFVGAKLDGQLWMTHEIFAEAELGAGIWSYGQHPPDSQGSNTLSGGSNMFNIKADVGYSYLWSGDFQGPKAFAKLGYRVDNYSLPASKTEFIGPNSFKCLFVGLGGELPVRNNIGVDLDFDIGVINSVSQSGGYSDGPTTSTNSVAFSLGGYYKMTNRLSTRIALEVLAQGADFSNQAAISQKIITLTPSLVYYF